MRLWDPAVHRAQEGTTRGFQECPLQCSTGAVPSQGAQAPSAPGTWLGQAHREHNAWLQAPPLQHSTTAGFQLIQLWDLAGNLHREHCTGLSGSGRSCFEGAKAQPLPHSSCSLQAVHLFVKHWSGSAATSAGCSLQARHLHSTGAHWCCHHAPLQGLQPAAASAGGDRL